MLRDMILENSVSFCSACAKIDYQSMMKTYFLSPSVLYYCANVNKKPSDTGNITEDSAAVANRTKITCTGANVSDEYVSEVVLVNGTELLRLLQFSSDSKHGNCLLVMFYAPYCPFSAKVAPAYNALGRAFRTLHVVAIDAVKFNSVNTRLGTFAVPNILFFHNGRPVLKFNNTDRTFDNLISFVASATGFQPNEAVNVTDEDYEGPLSSIEVQYRDYLLWLAWGFLISCAFWFVVQSHVGHRMMATAWGKIRPLVVRHEHTD